MADERYVVHQSQSTVKTAGVAKSSNPSGTPNQRPPASSTATKDKPAPAAAYRALHLAFHQAKNGGIYVPRDVAGTGTPSGHAEGRALDLKLSAYAPGEKLLGDAVFRLVIDSADAWGIDHVIWNREIWSTSRRYVHRFTGPYMRHGKIILDKNGHPAQKDPHIDHVHIEWTQAGSEQLRLQDIERKLGQLMSDVEDLGVYFDSRGVL